MEINELLIGAEAWKKEKENRHILMITAEDNPIVLGFLKSTSIENNAVVAGNVKALAISIAEIMRRESRIRDLFLDAVKEYTNKISGE